MAYSVSWEKTANYPLKIAINMHSLCKCYIKPSRDPQPVC